VGFHGWRQIYVEESVRAIPAANAAAFLGLNNAFYHSVSKVIEACEAAHYQTTSRHGLKFCATMINCQWFAVYQGTNRVVTLQQVSEQAILEVPFTTTWTPHYRIVEALLTSHEADYHGGLMVTAMVYYCHSHLIIWQGRIRTFFFFLNRSAKIDCDEVCNLYHDFIIRDGVNARGVEIIRTPALQLVEIVGWQRICTACT
jgi:hypothetical protein